MSERARRIYSVKQHGTTLTDRDSEPVHTPGCVQSHGALLAVGRPRARAAHKLELPVMDLVTSRAEHFA